MKSEVNRLLWVDLETTGLDPGVDRIIEAAAIVTEGKSFKEVATLEFFVKLEPDGIERLKSRSFLDWSSGKPVDSGKTVYDIHKENGLIDKVDKLGITRYEAEEKMCKFADAYFDSNIYLAGNSIHFDRRYMLADWPKLGEKLHYRMLDVSSFKLLMMLNGVEPYPKHSTHRALDDIRGSIEELRMYMQYFDLPKEQSN